MNQRPLRVMNCRGDKTTSAAAIPLAKDTKADDWRGRKGPIVLKKSAVATHEVHRFSRCEKQD